MPLRILLVDDDEGIRDSIAEFLEGHGHTIHVAEDGADAFAKLDEMSAIPDLILLDLMMPVKDGIEFRAEQRAHARYAGIPVVIMSADPQLDERRALLAARSYLRKPFDLRRLLAAVTG
jgi:DNA-binding response OmpR family regulator